MNLNKKQFEAIKLLLDGLNKSDIAKELNINRRTIYRWLEDEDFNNEYERQIDDIKDCAKNRLRRMMSKALDALERTLNDKNANARFLSAKEILNLNGIDESFEHKKKMDNKKFEQDKQVHADKMTLEIEKIERNTGTEDDTPTTIVFTDNDDE